MNCSNLGLHNYVQTLGSSCFRSGWNWFIFTTLRSKYLLGSINSQSNAGQNVPPIYVLYVIET